MTRLIKQRRAARVILLDQDDRLLLIRFEIRRGEEDFVFWATPGGGVEPREDIATAARRELMEELGLDLPLTGPVHEATAVFEHDGVALENTDIFFLGRCEASDPSLGGVDEAERLVMRDMRWWTADEITVSAEAVFPSDLADVVRRLTFA